MKPYKARNKRLIPRGPGGKFRKTTLADIGIGGFCPTCKGIMLRRYHGDPREAFLDPRLFRMRCLTCEPLTEEELKLEAEIEAARPKQKSIFEFFEDSIKDLEKD